MRLSSRTEYGIRAVIHLARLGPQGFIHSRDLALKEKMPRKFLENVLMALRRGGFVESRVGRDGGYRLARPPNKIAVADLVHRLETRLSAKENDAPPAADFAHGQMAVRLLNQYLTSAVDKELDKLTLEQLMENASKAANLPQAMYYI